jgi:Uma2 family endonuclease
MAIINKWSQLDLSKKYTYANYLTWRFTERVELIKGYVHKIEPVPNVLHQKVSMKLSVILLNYTEKNKYNVFAAPFDVRLFKKSSADTKVTTVVQPDLCIICDENKLDDRGCVGAPDLIIEIVSPGNSKRELKTKFDLYEENNVLEYWVVHPTEKSIQQFVLIKNKFQLVHTFFEEDKMECKVFKGLVIRVKNIF